MVLSRKARLKKLRTLAEIEGYESVEDMLEATALDAISPAICVADGCDYSAEMEPDQREGWCELGFRCYRTPVLSAAHTTSPVQKMSENAPASLVGDATRPDRLESAAPHSGRVRRHTLYVLPAST